MRKIVVIIIAIAVLFSVVPALGQEQLSCKPGEMTQSDGQCILIPLVRIYAPLIVGPLQQPRLNR